MANQVAANSERRRQTGSASPMMSSYMNGDSYEFLSPGSSNRGRYEVNGVSMMDVSLEQALERVQELKKENVDLRDQLKENNEILKDQYENLATWKEKIRQANIQNKEKYEQTKQVVLHLQEENVSLKRKLEDTEKGTHKSQQMVHAEKGEDFNNMSANLERLQTEIQQLQTKYNEVQSANQQLLKDLEKYSEEKEQLQTDNATLEQESTELSTKLQNVLIDSKATKSENKELRGRISELEGKLNGLRLGDRASSPYRDGSVENLGYNMVSSPDGLMKVQERNQATSPDTHHSQQVKEYESMVGRLKQELHHKNEELMAYQQRVDQAVQGDVQSLRSQVMSLIKEVNESQAKLKTTNEALEKKGVRMSELEHSLTRAQEELQAQRREDGALIENLRVSVSSYDEALKAERKELMNIRKQMSDVRMSFNKVVSENKELRDKLEASKDTKKLVMPESEKQKLLDEIGRLTASLLGAEEAISYKDQQIRDLKKANQDLKSEIENTIPVLKAQSEVWKADFDAERAAREAQHMEREKLKEDLRQLQVRNQQLVDELESSSRKQFSEMQQRHVPNPYQQTLQNRLGVVSPSGGYHPYNQPGGHNPGYQPQGAQGGQGYPAYPPQTQAYPNPYQPYPEYNNRSSTRGMENVTNQPQGFRQPSSGGSQNDEDLQLECPKCGQMCPDMDTLQIHVLECIDQEGAV